MSCLPRLDTSARAERERLVHHYDDQHRDLQRKRQHLADQLHRCDQEIAELAWSRQMHLGTVMVEE
jgi:hypothetical protein